MPCDQCHGTGAEGDGGSETCPTCKGSGSVIRNQQTILGTMQTRVTCSTCGGEGKIIKNKCKKCGGDGIIYGEEVVSVKIPAGVAEGMQAFYGWQRKCRQTQWCGRRLADSRRGRTASGLDSRRE